MSWQYSDAPNHIAPEVGPSLLTGDGPWSGVVLEPGAVYALSVEVNAPGETTVGWGVTATDGGDGEYVLADPADAETVPGGQWVTVTRSLPAPAFPTTATVALAVPTGTQARNPSMGALTGRTVLTVPGDVLAENIMASGGIIAGTPGGARVELTDEGLVSYDSTGTATAHIAGEGGSFVGGEFRTSDNLPGQVTLSDTAASGGPGISVAPVNAAGYSELPFVGPAGGGVRVSGGKNAAGESSFVSANPTAATLQAVNGSDTWTQISTDSLVASLVRYGADGSAGRVGVYPGFAIIEYEYEGTLRRIGVNNSGFFLSTKTGEGTTSRDLLSLFDRLDALEARVAALEN